ncbi:MAG: gamma-glutamylcyclotransferase [Marinobacterium sp.]|nr:gamma-glutamylcyclotransferase [Marinobacterium sp.]
MVGYGSLLSETSARETVPELTNFRLVEVPGYRRIFNKVGIVFFSRYNINPDSLEIASCSTEEAPESAMICSQFEVPESAFEALYEREHRFRWIEVETIDSRGKVQLGRMCSGWNDRDYRLNKCVTEAEYQYRVGQYYRGAIWRDDILPHPDYLTFCLQSAEQAGSEVLANFMDTTFLADGLTPVRQYLMQAPNLTGWRNIETRYSYR